MAIIVIVVCFIILLFSGSLNGGGFGFGLVCAILAVFVGFIIHPVVGIIVICIFGYIIIRQFTR